MTGHISGIENPAIRAYFLTQHTNILALSLCVVGLGALSVINTIARNKLEQRIEKLEKMLSEK